MFDHAWLTAFQNFGKSHFKNREKTPPLHFTAAAASGGCAARRCRSEANEFLTGPAGCARESEADTHVGDDAHEGTGRVLVQGGMEEDAAFVFLFCVVMICSCSDKTLCLIGDGRDSTSHGVCRLIDDHGGIDGNSISRGVGGLVNNRVDGVKLCIRQAEEGKRNGRLYYLMMTHHIV